jgi:hypothetical protein
MTLDDLAAQLPNGLHDVRLRTYSAEPAHGRAELVVDVWIGDLQSAVMAERERRCPARLELLGLAYFVVDDRDLRYPVTGEAPVQIDACAADDDPELARRVPPGGFAGRFFVTEWNAFIHFAALEARLTWMEVN